VRSPLALTRQVEGEVLLARIGRQDVDRLTGAAVSVWRFLETPMELPDLLARLEGVYGVEPQEIASDIQTLVGDLLSRGWLEAVAENDG
jgi:hypothetical protein